MIVPFIKKHLKKENVVNTLEKLCFAIGIASIFLSILLIFIFGEGADPDSAKAQRLGIFVGLWAPTLVAIACYLKPKN